VTAGRERSDVQRGKLGWCRLFGDRFPVAGQRTQVQPDRLARIGQRFVDGLTLRKTARQSGNEHAKPALLRLWQQDHGIAGHDAFSAAQRQRSLRRSSAVSSARSRTVRKTFGLMITPQCAPTL
jgi:hypothetical protein